MNRRTKITVSLATAGAALVAGAGIAVAGGGDDFEAPISGEARDRAAAAALDHTGGGRVTETEVGDDESHYEVEVTLDDVRRVDVSLDREFRVIGSEADGPSQDDDD